MLHATDDKTYNWLPARSVEPFLNSYSARAKVKDVQPALAAAWALLGHKLPARNAGVRTLMLRSEALEGLC